eukprot:Skav229275  [mRNA]  locus=scaffold952:283799:288455:- [translate_table: standard]
MIEVRSSVEGLLKKVELSIKLGSSLILVLAHKGSMALLHASERFLAGEVQIPTPQTATDMGPADASFVSESAMTRNVFQTMQFLLTSSAGLRQRVRSGELEVHGGMFEPFTKVVQFMGPVPGQEEFLTETETANAAKERSGTHETRETSETMPEAGAVFPDEEAPVAVEKAGDSISQRSQSHDGTSPGTDCGQSEPTSSQEDVAEVAELQAAEETAEVLEEVEEVEEVEDRDDRDQEAEKTSLQPEESQISQESGESSTTAPSQVSYVIGEHPSSLPVEASPAEEQALEQDERQARQAVESGGAVDETEAEVQRGHGDLQFDVQLLAANDMAEWNAEGETAEGKVLLGPYFSAAFEIWKLGSQESPKLRCWRQCDAFEDTECRWASVPEEPEPEQPKVAEGDLKNGSRVEIHGLESETGKQLNGQAGTITNFLEDKGRYQIALADKVALQQHFKLACMALSPKRAGVPKEWHVDLSMGAECRKLNERVGVTKEFLADKD